MKISRRNFLKKGLAGTLLLGAATLPQSLTAFAAVSSISEANRKKSRRVVYLVWMGYV